MAYMIQHYNGSLDIALQVTLKLLDRSIPQHDEVLENWKHFCKNIQNKTKINYVLRILFS